MTRRPRATRSFAPSTAFALLCLVPLAGGCGRNPFVEATPPPPPEDTRPATPDPGTVAVAPAEAVPDAPEAGQAAPAAEASSLAERQRELDRREAELDAREEALEARSPSPSPASRPAAPDRTPARATAPAPAPRPAPVEARPAPANEPQAEPAAEDPTAAAPAALPDPDDESWRRRPGDEGLERSDEGDGRVASLPGRTYTLPAGTRFDAELLAGLSSATSVAGDPVRARLRQPLVVDGTEVVPAGSEVVGEVTEAVPLARVGGQARLVLDFRRLEPRGSAPVAIDAELATKGENETARDAATIGGAAVGGAVLGRVLNRDHKGKGTLIGAIVGAAAGTVIASKSAGQEVVLPQGARLQLVLDQPVEVEVRATPPPR